MIITTRFAIFLALSALIFIASTVLPVAALLGFAYIAMVFVLGIADRFLTVDASDLDIERECDDKLSLGAENKVVLHVRNRSRWPLALMVRDEPPYKFKIEGNVARIELKPRQQKDITYHVAPHARGDYSFGDIYVRVTGPLGLAVRQYRVSTAREIKVYPNLIELRKYDLLIRRGRKIEAGMRRMRLYGRGTEFESLREYVPDDEFRQIDWKTSARRGKLISRQYQVERSQNIVLVLDAGRTMSVRIGEMAKIDYAINSALMLAYVATSGDDKVGLLTFSDQVDSFLPPNKGRSQSLAITQSLYNVPLTTKESDYAGAFLYLARRWRKRSLVVVFSDLLDPESSRQIITHLQMLSKTHLCMCVAISDSQVLAAANRVPHESMEMYEKAAATEVLYERDQAVAALERTGVVVVDSEPGTLSPDVINKYLEIKARIRL